MTSSRGSNWSSHQTKVLAELKNSSNEAGRITWEGIASTISARFPNQAKNPTQCRRRWETLVKLYRKVEKYCGPSRAHTELSGKEIQSLKTATAYHREWYSIVKEICDRRMADEPSDTRSVGDPLQARSPPRNIQPSASTSGEPSKQVETNIVPRSVERESPSHIQQYGAANIAGAMGINQSEATGAFKIPPWSSTDANHMRTYQSMDDPKTSTASGMSKEPLMRMNEKWANSLIETPPEWTQVETNIVPSGESPNHIPQYGIAGGSDINQLEAFGAVEIPPLSTTEAHAMRSYLTKISTACGISGKQVDTNMGQERESPNQIPQYGVENIARDLDINQSEAIGAFEIPSSSSTDANHMITYQSMSDSKISTASEISKKSPDENWYPPEWRTEHETEHETEQVETVTVPMSVDRSSASHIQQYGAANIAGAMGINQPQDEFGIFELPEWGAEDANRMMYMFQISRASSISTVMKPEVCFQSSEFIHESDTDSDLESNSCS